MSAAESAPSAPREIELKFDLDPASVEPIGKLLTLWSHERAGRPEPLHSIYYDTDDGDLRKGGYSLRLRKEGGRWLQTAKSAVRGEIDRGEWESEAPDGLLQLDALAGTPIDTLLDRKGVIEELKPQFEVTVSRTRRRIRDEGQDVEASLDTGAVGADGRSDPICELELELKAGEAKGLFSLARSLAENEPLTLSFISKSARGYALLDGAEASAVNANKAAVLPGASTAEAFQQIGRECLSQLTANAAVLRRAHNPDAVHQARVGIRRLRAALSLFKDVVCGGPFDRLKAEFKWLGGELGDARNLDVFVENAFRPAADREAHAPGMTALGAALQGRKDVAYARAAEALASRRYRDLVLDAAEWIETGDWLAPADADDQARLDAPAKSFAAKAIRRRLKKMKSRGRNLSDLDAHGRHELRIAGKKLRYAVEFFQALPKGKAVERQAALLKVLKPLQEVLGDLNDVVTGAELAADLARASSDPNPDLAFAAGLAAGRRNDQEAGLLKQLARRWKAFEKAQPVW
jgi:inorganic triphosphatase YgiF